MSKVKDYQEILDGFIHCQEERAKYYNLYRGALQAAADASNELDRLEKTLTAAQTESTKNVLAKREIEARVAQLEAFILKAGLTVPEPQPPVDPGPAPLES